MNLLCWGSGELGQTGRGRRKDIDTAEAHMREFTPVGLRRVKLMACGSSHSIGITEDNKIFAWGNGTSGQLGDGERSMKDQPVEVQLPQTPNVTEKDVNIAGVACGSRHSFIWTESGRGYSFGNNFYAQLGYDFQRADFKEHQLAPRLFQSLPSSLKISQVACGERHTLFALEDGSVAACGQNDYGQIGSGSNANAVIPHFVEGVGHVLKVTCGANHNLALTGTVIHGDGRLFQWGCGRACGNTKRNILLPEEVALPSSPVRGIAGGCWHSLLLTDGGNVFSWGMGQEGQLGLGEDRIHISTPCLLSYSQLTEVAQIQAGDSYSAAITGGELLLWGQIPCVSRVSDHTGLKRIWTPQPVPLAGGKVCGVACGTWHMMALTAWSLEYNGECPHPDTEACFRDLAYNPVPTEHTEKENTEHDSRQVQHKLFQGLTRPEGSEEQGKYDESESPEDRHEDNPSKDGVDGALHDSAFAITRSTLEMDRGGNGHSSIKFDKGAEGESFRTAGPWELRKGPRRRGSTDVVFTTLHLLPRSEGEQCKATAGVLPRLQTGQQAHSRVSSGAQKGRSVHLTDLVQKSRSDSSPRIIPKPRPPGRSPGHADEMLVSCHYSGNGTHSDNNPVHKSYPRLSPGHLVEKSSPSFHSEPQRKTSLCPTPSTSEPLRHCPTHRRDVSSSGKSRKNL
ncbi:secretion-regulating guanine nucleotide exchange factor-like isoform X2 [Notolabrus celidotus]|uniref:secretion-regulating guanine nucleotide exchange factor-like isoform X2 n=1 Tax=Notolabrus celidotus TaxID=1203425 RepID=UPI00148FF23B|nr:secretion-regulating guanine nucleotide exchange factor-like isoform X2 [Notolabrus celidotus]